MSTELTWDEAEVVTALTAGNAGPTIQLEGAALILRMKAGLGQGRARADANFERTDNAGTVLYEVARERGRQDAKWGEQDHPDGTGPKVYWVPISSSAECVVEDARYTCQFKADRGEVTWRDIALEEVAEAFTATGTDLRAELVQVAAVAVAWIESIDRRLTTTEEPRTDVRCPRCRDTGDCPGCSSGNVPYGACSTCHGDSCCPYCPPTESAQDGRTGPGGGERTQEALNAWIVPKIAHDQNRLVGPRVHGRWIHRAAGQSDPDHARRYAAELLAAADEAEKAEG